MQFELPSCAQEDKKGAGKRFDSLSYRIHPLLYASSILHFILLYSVAQLGLEGIWIWLKVSRNIMFLLQQISVRKFPIVILCVDRYMHTWYLSRR